MEMKQRPCHSIIQEILVSFASMRDLRRHTCHQEFLRRYVLTKIIPREKSLLGGRY